MNLSIDQEVQGHSPEQVVEAIYYAMRYIKQASRAKRMDKDIFQDADQSAPSEAVRALTLAIVHSIERAVGMNAENFDHKIFSTVFTFLSKAARTQKGAMSEADRREAEALVAELLNRPES